VLDSARRKWMDIEVIGCDGAPAPGRLPMTLLVNETVMIDAGSAVSGLDPARAGKVKAVLLSHGHLDHIRELGFLPFHRDPERDGLLDILGTEKVIRAVRSAVFNADHWIDFERPRPPRKPGIRYRVISPETPVDLPGMSIEAVSLSHSTYETSGFLLERDGGTLVYALDSGPTDRIWERARERADVPAVFFDVSFPDRFADTVGEHLTPSGLRREVKKLEPHTPRVFAVHLKPEFREETMAELRALPFPVEVPSAGDTIRV
jgi:ribonuclease BN (tRNA processing enzyme)